MKWPEDLDHIAWPFNDSIGDFDLGGIGLGSIHGWGGEHFNIPSIMAEQVIPLTLTIVVFPGLIIYTLFRIGWVRTRRDVLIVMFTGAVMAFVTLTLVAAFFRGQGQDLIWPWKIKVDEG